MTTKPAQHQEQTTAIATISARDEYPIISLDAQELGELIEMNMGDEEGLSPRNLDTIKVPLGGITYWAVPTAPGETEDRPTFRGIPLFFHSARTLYLKPYGGQESAQAPDCSSDDGKVGISPSGVAGGPCKTCHYAQWGSDPKGGRGQACRQHLMLYVSRPGTRFPTLIKLATTSMAGWRDFTIKLTDQGVRLTSVVVEFGLKKNVSGGFTYAVATFKVVGKLPDDEAQAVRDYARMLHPQLMPSQVQAAEVAAIAAAPAAQIGAPAATGDAGTQPF